MTCSNPNSHYAPSLGKFNVNYYFHFKLSVIEMYFSFYDRCLRLTVVVDRY